MAQKRKFTVRVGFTYFVLNDRGTIIDRKTAGETIELDPESKEFLDQKIKFDEFYEDKKSFPKKKISQDPVGLIEKRDREPKGLVDKKTKAQQLAEQEKKQELQEGSKPWLQNKLKEAGIEFKSSDKVSVLKDLWENHLKDEEEDQGGATLLKVEDIEEGTFPVKVSNFDFSSADKDYLEAWALNLAIETPEDADEAVLEKMIKEAVSE